MNGKLFTKNFRRKGKTQEQALFLNKSIYSVITQLLLDANQCLSGENYRLLPYSMKNKSIPLIVPVSKGILNGIDVKATKPLFFREFFDKEITMIAMDLSINSYGRKKSYQIALTRKTSINLSTGKFSTDLIGNKMSSDSEKIPSKVESIYDSLSADSELLIIMRDNYFMDKAMMNSIIVNLKKKNENREILVIEVIKSGSGAAVGWKYDLIKSNNLLNLTHPSIFGFAIDHSFYLFHSQNLPSHGLPNSLGFTVSDLSTARIMDLLATPINNNTGLASLSNNIMTLATFLARDSQHTPHPEINKEMSILKISHNVSRLSDDINSSFIKYIQNKLSGPGKESYSWKGNLLF